MRHVDSSIYSGESVLIPRKGSLNNVLYVDSEFWTVDTMFYTNMKIPNLAKYAYLYIKNLNLADLNVGSAVPSMTTTILNRLDFPLPNELELLQFEKKVSPLFSKIIQNNEENKQLEIIRDLMLPKLLSGEIPVNQATK